MRVRYTATEQRLYDADFACRTCRYEAKVKVLGVGVGTATEGLFAGGGASSDAVIEARATMGKHALETLGLVRCRKCQTRGPAARRWAIASWAKSAGFGVVAGWLLLKLLPSIAIELASVNVALLALPAVLATPLIYRFWFHPVLRVADERVTFPARGW